MSSVVLLVNREHQEVGKRLQWAVESVVPANNLDVYKDIFGLYKRLLRLPKEISVIVLFPADNKQLSELMLLNLYLENIPIILILPDGKKETVSRGCKLYPRFISSINSDFTDVSAVLEKMLELADSRERCAFG